MNSVKGCAMKVISRIIAVVLFILFFGFALKNTDPVTLHLFFGYEFPGPLVLMLLIFFIAGIVFGVFAMLPTLFRHRRELSKHKKTLAAKDQEIGKLQTENSRPPQPDSV
jgi:lipopolysaccharide assembly protein A